MTGLVVALAIQAQSGEGALRDLADSRGKLIGTAVNGGLIDPGGSTPQALRDILAAEFNVYVAESRYKMAYVLPNAPADPFNVQVSDLNTDSIDGLVNLARTNGVQKIRGHVLIWHQGMPPWLETAASGWNAQQITDFATSYITAVLTYCRENAPEIYEWDVINETIDSGSGAFRTGTWYDAANRQDFIDALFHAALAADPNIRLVYNDYGIEYAENSKTTFMLNMVEGMLSRGVPLDGVGLQCHFAGPDASGNGGFTTTSAASFRDVFVQLANRGLDCIVTELDLRLKTDSSTTEGNVTTQQLAEQGVQYERIVATALSQPNCPAVLTWGFSDAASWIPSYFPGYGHALLYDRDHQPKPAYFGVSDALASLPVTQTPPTVDSQSVRALKDQPKSITLTGTDAQEDALTYSVVNGPTNGVLDDTAPPDLVYTPNPGYVGTDSFTFKANDGVFDSAPGTISITIVASNAPPAVNAGTDRTVTLSTSAPWSPTYLDPAAWYDAADTNTITASGGAVSQWSDKSGNGNHVMQGTSTARPTTASRTLNGLNVIDFDGSNDELLDTTFASLSSLNLSIFAVQQHDRLDVQSMTAWGLGRNTIEDGLIIHSSFDAVFTFGYRYPENKPVYYTENTNVELLSYVKSGTSSQQAWVDGVSRGVQSAVVTTFTTQRLALGSRFSANYLDGGIGEFIVMPSAVPEGDRQKLEGYLAHKWGLEASLPTNHSYKVDAPTVPTALVSLSDASVTDADGDTLSNTWTVVSAPAGGSAVFDNANRVNATVALDTVGTYVLRLTADDGIETAFDEVRIIVTDTNSTATVNGTPYAWLDSFGITNDYELADLGDPDGDGALTWQEYQAGTDPTNAMSVFRLMSATIGVSGDLELVWYGTTNSGVTTAFVVYRCTNLLSGGWEPVSTNTRSATGTNTWSGSGASGAAFYRIGM